MISRRNNVICRAVTNDTGYLHCNIQILLEPSSAFRVYFITKRKHCRLPCWNFNLPFMQLQSCDIVKVRLWHRLLCCCCEVLGKLENERVLVYIWPVANGPPIHINGCLHHTRDWLLDISSGATFCTNWKNRNDMMLYPFMMQFDWYHICHQFIQTIILVTVVRSLKYWPASVFESSGATASFIHRRHRVILQSLSMSVCVWWTGRKSTLSFSRITLYTISI